MTMLQQKQLLKSSRQNFVKNQTFANLDALKLGLADYVNWFNNHRLHSSLGYLTPVEYRQNNLKKVVQFTVDNPKYKIRSKGKLQTWIKKYNSHEELKSSGTGGNIIMTKGRRTTFDERVEIVQYCIAHNHNYMKTAEHYQYPINRPAIMS